MKVVTKLDKKITDDNIVNYKRKKTTSEIIDEQEEIIQALIENMPTKTTEQATAITVDDATKYSRNKLEIFGNTEQRVFKGYNLFNKESENIVNNCRLNQSGENMNAEGYFISDYIEIDKNEEYTISYVPDAFTRIVFYSEDKTYINRNDKSQTYTAPETAVYLRFCNLLTEIDNIQLVTGGENKPYEPFTNLQPSPSPDIPQDIHIVTGENTINVNDTQYQLDLKDIELCRIEDYQDVLFKNEKNSKYYDSNLIENAWYYDTHFKQVIDNADKFTTNHIENDSTKFYFRMTLNNDIESVNFNYKQVGLINHGKVNNSARSTASGKTQGFNLGANYLYYYTEEDSTLTLDEFKEKWNKKLASEPLVIIAKNNSQTPIQITDETLISQLEELYAHIRLEKGTNNITVTAEDLAPLMQLTYMQDIQSRLNNIETIALEANS